MILDNINITCYKYQFSSNLLLEERNFFNYTNPPVLVSSINLKSYLLDIGQLQFSFDDTTENSYHLIPSEINFTVASVTAITDFFSLYDSDIYNRYKVEIKYNGLVIWLGIINPDSFKQSYRPSPDSYRLSFTSFGLEKEFSDYFKTKFLDAVTTFTPDDSLGINYTNFVTLLGLVFGNSIIYEADSDISNFRVAHDDSLIKTKTSLYYPIVFVKAGFNNIVDLKETKFDWFKKTLSAMGWVFYFRGDTMIIKNRRSLLGSNYNILSSVLLEWEYNKQFAESGYNHIFIPDSTDITTGSGLATNVSGDLSGLDMYGQRGYLFSDLTQNYLESTPFRNWQVNPALGSSSYLWIWENAQNVTVYVDDDGNLIVQNALTTNAGNTFNYTGSINYLNNDRILKLDTGKSKGRLNTSNPPLLNGNNIYDPNEKTFDLYQITDINYGNALYRYDNNTQKYTTYQDYMRTSQALYNFSSMLQSKSIKRVKAKVKSLLLDNKEDNFYFDSTEIPNAVKFSLNSISYDLINEITTLELEQNV